MTLAGHAGLRRLRVLNGLPRGHDVLWITSWWSQPPFQPQRRRGRSRGLRVDGAAHSQRCSRLTARTRHHGPRHSSSWPWPRRSRSPWWSRCSFSKTTSSWVVPFCRRRSEPKAKLLSNFRSSGRHINFQYFCFAQKNSNPSPEDKYCIKVSVNT